MINNLEKKMKLAIVVMTLSIITCITVVISVLIFTSGLIKNERNNIYVLDNGVPILVKQTGLDVNLEVEIKSHVNLFHMFFFTLPPDDEFIRKNIEKAMYLIDESGIKQYNNLKEKGYYNQLLASSAIATILCDSIIVDLPKMEFVYYGTQRVERETKVIKRQLVTVGAYKKVPRTDNNPHGLIILNWKTISNKDISTVSKRLH